MSRAAGVPSLAGGILMLALVSCSSRPGPAGSTPPRAPMGEPESEASDKVAEEEGGDGSRALDGDPLATLGAELAAAEVELQGLESYEFDAASNPAAERCEAIRSLAEAICDLSGQICQLADEHPEQRRYVDACGRAEQTCEQAALASADCSA